jgi:uncharacterized phage infection (PIP) family protein YhgE
VKRSDSDFGRQRTRYTPEAYKDATARVESNEGIVKAIEVELAQPGVSKKAADKLIEQSNTAHQEAATAFDKLTDMEKDFPGAEEGVELPKRL